MYVYSICCSSNRHGQFVNATIYVLTNLEQVADYILMNITLIEHPSRSKDLNTRSLRIGNWEEQPQPKSELKLSKTIGDTEIRNLDAVFKAIRERRSEFRAILKEKLDELKASGYFIKDLSEKAYNTYLSLLIDCRFAGEMMNFLWRKDVLRNVSGHIFGGYNAIRRIDLIAALMPDVCFDTDKSPLYCHNETDIAQPRWDKLPQKRH
ncbi:hypothetical protein DdX_06177 [Ditylenchus destructor]|uniref:Uncharacterized protein n=1 Tax=Ditylenchus destructor TaxID=166010 RepID=A0AAD4NC79_9BILA|nr:hypothetical protein DdX_06177 [Ditylenchus destructor]